MDEPVYTARFWRHFEEQSEECDTLDEAVAFLSGGWERAELSEIEILGPDGEVALGGEELFQRMLDALV